jgi:phosphoserine phosphatase RsbU/P
MDDQQKSKKQLINELEILRQQVADLESREGDRAQAELTLRRAQDALELQAREWAAELETIRQASLSLTSSLELPDVLEAILQATLQLVSAENAHIFLYNNDHKLSFGAALFADGRRGEAFAEPRPGGLTYTVAQQGQPLIINDMRSHPLFINTSYNLPRAIVGLPLKMGQQVVGVMTISRAQPFSKTELHPLYLLADHAAIAIENARLYEALQKANDELEARVKERTAEIEAIWQASLILTASLELPQVLESILRTTLDLVSAENAHIFLYTDDTLSFGAALLADGRRGEPLAEPRPGGLTHTTAVEGRSIVVDDMRTHPLYANSPYARQRAIVGLPLKMGQRVVGVMNLSRPQPFTKAELQPLHLLADHAAIAIENARLYEAVQKAKEELEIRVQERTAEIEAIRQAGLSLTASLELTHVLEAILRATLDLVSAENAHIFLYAEGRLSFGAALLANGRRGEPLAEPRADGLTYTVAQQGQPIVINDMSTHALYASTPFAMEHAIIGLPLKISQRVVGVMNISRPRPFAESELRPLRLLADHAAIAIENARLYSQTQAVTARLQGELALAQKIQQSLLPPAQTNWSGLDVFCYSHPAREVGGDFYAYYASISANGGERDRFAVAVGDVSGKGMPAALLMAVSRASLQSVITQTDTPGALLAQLDRAIVPYTRTTRQNCALCYVEITLVTRIAKGEKGGVMRVANAGCIMPLIRHVNGGVNWAEVGGMPLGIGLGAQFGYQEISLTLSTGDLIILTSDGVVEANNAAREMFGFERLEQAVAVGPSTSAEAMLTHLQAEVAAFVGDKEPHDDLTIVVMQIKG